MNWKAAKTSTFLSVLFLVVYGTTNWLASLRQDVGSFVFNWERQIPFVPLMIVPYMSIDLFYVAGPFICRDDRQRQIFACRIAAAVLVAGACFYLFPLRFTLARPHVEGVLGLIFNNFRVLDQPFNEFPALHIALCVLLADLYGGRFREWGRGAVLLWFALIALSAVLTYQHHVIDVAGGFVLAWGCVRLFPSDALAPPVHGNARVGFYYLTGAIVLVVGAGLGRPWTFLLLWPAISMALMGAAHLGVGTSIFRKCNGRLPLTTWLIFWPVILGQKLSLIYYARQDTAWNRLTERVWIGRRLSARQAAWVIEAGVTAVVDLTCELPEAPPFRRLAYRQIPVLDLASPTIAQLHEAVEFIVTQAAGGIVYVHCKVGYSRTAGVGGAYLLRTGQAETAEQAIALLRTARPGIIIRPEIVLALEEFARGTAKGKPGRQQFEMATEHG